MKTLRTQRKNHRLHQCSSPLFGFAAAVFVTALGTVPVLHAKPFIAPQAVDTEGQAQVGPLQAAAAAEAQKVQDLTAQAEALYRAGVDNYNADHLDDARHNFDAAVDLLLSSGISLKDDSPLSDEFEDLVSRINSLELIALKQGNGFSPKVDEAPIDIASDVTFTPDAALNSKVANELKTTQSDFPLVLNEYVAGWIEGFSRSNARIGTLKRSLERAGKYQAMISRVLAQYGLPQDLIYQAITESGFQPQALNRGSGAGGMWQFMPFAGAYGLERNGYFDERFDPEKSTIAYAKYMKYLYSQFGDWYLAMAAYDWGPGRVQHVVARTGYADYWELYRRGNLPGETKAYIPGVIAMIIIAKNPKQYGLTDLTPDPPVLSDTVTTDYAIDMRLVADLTDSTVADVVALNPALLRLSTPADIPYDLHLPVGTKAKYIDRLKDIPEQNRASWRFHVVKAGETLDQVATSLHSRPAEIAELNELKPGQQLEDGDELVIPVAAVSTSHGQSRYTARSGDTLVTVADRFGVSVEQLREWNHLSTTRVTPGRSLAVAEPLRLAPGSRSARSRRGAAASSSRTHRSAGLSSHAHASAYSASKNTSGTKRRR